MNISLIFIKQFLEKNAKENLAKNKLAVLEKHQISEKDYDSYCQIILKDDK